jgi:hypothetical protein
MKLSLYGLVCGLLAGRNRLVSVGGGYDEAHSASRLDYMRQITHLDHYAVSYRYAVRVVIQPRLGALV